MLDYWITTGVLGPSGTYQAVRGARDLFLFSFEDLVQIRVVRSLRLSGVSLQRVRAAIKVLRRRTSAWQSEWLVTDGRDVFTVSGHHAIESLSTRHAGQLAFSIVALGEVQKAVKHELNRFLARPFDAKKYRGRVHVYRSMAGGAA